ncbi:MAG: uncharacterized protein QOE70_6592 [Chthoniobacter sp.]|nr:uncharacterized protein [Chthoniobacter sp.]
MKTLILTAAILAIVLMPVRSANESDRAQLADELLTTMRLESSFRSGWTSYPPVDGGADHPDPVEVSKALWLKLKPEYVKAYADVFTEEELRALIAFYKSPTGQTFLDKTPDLTRKLTAAHQKQIMEALKSK